MSKIDYTLWPNANGTLGQNKVAIPDGVTVQWPEGDALVENFVYKDGLISGFVDTMALIANESKTSTIPYDYVNIRLDSIGEGDMTITGGERTKYFTVRYVTSNDGFVTIRFEDMDEETKSLLRSATKIINNTLYDENDDVIGTFETRGLLTGSNAVFNMDRDVRDYVSTDGKDLDALFSIYGMERFEEEVRELPLTVFNSDLSSLTNGTNMFYSCETLTSFSSNMRSLKNGYGMFGCCYSLTSFDADLSSLEEGYNMFESCETLTSFESNLDSLKVGDYMFGFSTSLSSFKSNLPSLKTGEYMFDGCTSLTSFDVDMSSLEDGYCMFEFCTSLSSFKSDLSSLNDGTGMFEFCYDLSSFTSNLSSLRSGSDMFRGCKLNAQSISNILSSISNCHDIDMGIGCNDTEEDKNLFAQEVGYSDMVSLIGAFTDKNCTVTFSYKGRPTTTYGLRRTGENSLPIFAKLIEVETNVDGRKLRHTHTSMDESKKYRLDWFHETNGSTEGYTQFASVEEAEVAFNIKSFER